VLHILGYSIAEIEALGNISKLVGKNLFDLEILESQGKIQNIETIISDKSGKKRDYLISVKRVSIKGGTILYTCHDVTERKQAEEALKEYSERLEAMVDERTRELKDAQEELIRKEKLATLGELAGGVAHELRNPLGVLSNAVYYLNLILTDADEKTKEYLDILSMEVRKSEKIVTDLLGFSRTRLTEKTEREAVAVSELVARVLVGQPPPEQVEISTQLDPDLPPVLVNPQQIGQVLTNLVANAYQAMPDGGNLNISAATQKNEVVISVNDTGVGIPPENIDKLFEPLFTTKAKGIGLGLAVSRNLLEANGGRIEVESEEGEGSTFTILLPVEGGRDHE
jgi:signal transduction histidine kinase